MIADKYKFVIFSSDIENNYYDSYFIPITGNEDHVVRDTLHSILHNILKYRWTLLDTLGQSVINVGLSQGVKCSALF